MNHYYHYARQAISIFLITAVSVMINEIGHYLAALYFNLSPTFIMTFKYIGVEAIRAAPLENLAVLNMGALANIITATALFLTIILRPRSCLLLDDTPPAYMIVAILVNLLFAIAELTQPFFSV